MKKMTKYLSCLLALLLLLSFVTSCKPSKDAAKVTDAVGTTAETPVEENPKSYAVFGREYTLSDADREALSKALEETLTLMQNNAEEALIDEKVEQIEELFYHIADQADLAYVLFCMDQEDETASDNYLYASEMKNDVFYDYMVMCQKVDASSYAYRARFFEDWSENDFLQMRQYTDEVSAINKANDEILVKYRALDPEGEDFEKEVDRLYVEMVKNNQKLAEMFGFSDYASYAYEVVYQRDYSREELAALRKYVKDYLLMLCKQAGDAFLAGYQELSLVDQIQLGGWLQGDYSSLSGDPVGGYLASLPTSMRDSMARVLQSEHSVFTNDQKSYAGAFTGYFYEDSYPFCYFGPGYQSVFTVIHEAGHFYAADCQGGLDIDLDLAELHSQGNEWLMMEYSKKQMSDALYDVLLAYQFYESVSTIVISTMVDEFEEMVYTNAAALDGSVEQLDKFMAEICVRYGGKSFIEEYMTDVSSYWKYVVIESPVYYISYAVSGISAMSFYGQVASNYNAALETYQAFTAGELVEDAFLENLKNAGVSSPFEEKAYTDIAVAWATRNRSK